MSEARTLKEQGGERYLSLDAYRGLVMMTLVSGTLIHGVCSRWPLLHVVVEQFVHAQWAGFTLWDLIMPSFMFLVGASLPYSCASRILKGQSRWQVRLHVLRRSAVFILLGILVSSQWETQTRFIFTGLLTQFGLTYPWAFLLVGRGVRVQGLAVALILAGYWLVFYLYPPPPESFDFHSVGLPENVEPFTGMFAHWNRGTNLAAAFDLWFINLFPQAEEYRFDRVGNQTLNFIPSIATMTIGIMAGELLRSRVSKWAQLTRLVVAGAVMLSIGVGIGQTLCPIVKSIWTPSWVLFSGGVALLAMGGAFWLVEIKEWSRLVFPFAIVGMNSLAIYLLYMLTTPWLVQMAQIHYIRSWVAQQLVVIITLWLTCFWMYRRRVFLRV